MFYKLVQNTDFDALEGGMMMTAKEVIAVVYARGVKDAEIMFEFMKRKGIIYYSSEAVTIEEATREEFDDFIKNS